MSTILCFSVNMGCCVYINEEKKMNLNDFSKWLQYNKEWKNLRGPEYFPYPLYIQCQHQRGFTSVLFWDALMNIGVAIISPIRAEDTVVKFNFRKEISWEKIGNVP